MSPLDIDIHIVSWRGRHSDALTIAAALEGGPSRVSIIHSEPGDVRTAPDRRYILTPDDWFFGRKFRQSLAAFQGDVLLQIMADARCDDWPGLARRCKQAFALMPMLGVWAPEVHGTYWTLPRVRIAPIELSSPEGVVLDRLCCVSMVDAVVWAIRRDVADRLAQLNYETNNLGWGISEAACAHSHVTGRLAVIDSAIPVVHPPGSGYDHEEARNQREAFVSSLDVQERAQIILIADAFRFRAAIDKAAAEPIE